MKKITLLCGICICCLSAFAQSSKTSAGTSKPNDVNSAAMLQAQTEKNSSPKLHFSTPYLVGSSTVYEGDDYTYSVDGADPGSTYSAWSSSDTSIAELVNASGSEGTFHIKNKAGSFTIYVQVNSGGTIYYLSMSSQSVKCTGCPIP